MTTEGWKLHAYPLQLITIELQGTRHTTSDDLLSQLQTVTDRIKNGDVVGESSDDDFGYRFSLSEPPKSVFGDKPTSFK